MVVSAVMVSLRLTIFDENQGTFVMNSITMVVHIVYADSRQSEHRLGFARTEGHLEGDQRQNRVPLK